MFLRSCCAVDSQDRGERSRRVRRVSDGVGEPRDYYVGGELEGNGGAWHGSPDALGELGLDPTRPVGRSELVALMEGRSPATGMPLRRVGGDGSRVAGIDATFSAPKSVSAVWAVSDPYRRAQIEVAHRKAVASAVRRIERDVELVRRRERGELRWENARSLVAAEFVHTSSRLTRDQERDGVPDPQLHSHVVILTAQRQDGRFAAVDSREVFRSQRARDAGIDASAERHGHALSVEQREALETITGPGGVVVLVGEAGTGKGVVLDAAREAWERENQRVIGTAVAGATAQRLGVDAGMQDTMTVDSLIHRVEHDKLTLDSKTVVVMDESGMADTRRLARLVEITRESDSKLVLAGDSAQLSPIGAGGLLKELTDNVPTARLSEVHRANHEWERNAWAKLRNGDAERALGDYQARGRLHIEDTRAQAGERMVNDWAETRAAHPGERVVMITDASNHELDMLNKHAQQHRLDGGELGTEVVAMPELPYGLRSGDEIIFTAQHRVPGQERVENGTRGTITQASERDSRVLVRTDEPKRRDVDVSTREFEGLRLAYAQHVYKAQGLTSDRALVLTGGWQTDREAAYVALTRAREQTNIYTSREDLGHASLNTDAVNRLAERANKTNAQQTSISRETAEPDREPGRFAREVRHALGRETPPDRERREDAEPDRDPGSFARELREAMGPDEPRERQRDSREEAEMDRETGSFTRELREAMGRDEPREREREDAPAPGGFGEQLRRIQQEQREHDRDRGEGLEL